MSDGMILSPTQKIHTLIGRPDPSKDRGLGELDGPCLVCGHEYPTGSPSKYALSKTDTDHDRFAAPWSDMVCSACTWCSEGRPPDTLRMWSMLYREDGPPSLIIRCPLEDLGYIHKLEGKDIRVSHHMLRLGEPVVRDIEPHHKLRCPLVLVTSDDESRGVRGVDFGVHVGKRLGAMLGHLNFGVDVGTRRAVHIAGSRCFGHPVTVKSLTDEESVMLQCAGIGESRGMGLGAFWPEGRR